MDDNKSIGSDNCSSIHIFICGTLKTPTAFISTCRLKHLNRRALMPAEGRIK